jgi:hypothetical protein
MTLGGVFDKHLEGNPGYAYKKKDQESISTLHN